MSAKIRDWIIRFLLSIASNMLPEISHQIQITDKIVIFSVLSEMPKRLLFLINKYKGQLLDVRINAWLSEVGKIPYV